MSKDGGLIRQGDIYWFDAGPPRGSTPAYHRPHVVVQNDSFNHSPIQTTLLCSVTTNLRLSSFRGNVVLAAGEANLPEQSVVNVTQMVTADKRDLTEYIGTLRPQRVRQIVDGLRLVFEPRERG